MPTNSRKSRSQDFTVRALTHVLWILRSIVIFSVFANLSPAQAPPGPVTIRVEADHPEGPWPAVWNYFGYDEPNYTYAPNGQKLLRELNALSPQPGLRSGP